MNKYERGKDGFLHQKGRSCMLCARLKDNKKNDGYNCKYSKECNEENNYSKFKPTYESLSPSNKGADNKSFKKVCPECFGTGKRAYYPNEREPLERCRRCKGTGKPS